MKNAGKVITVYNYFLDQETGYDACQRTYIEGVSVFAQTKVNVDKEGLSTADMYILRIPEAAAPGYASPKDFQKLPIKAGSFTLAKGDKIVLGYAGEESATPAYLEEKYGNESVLTITDVTDNRGKREPHWKVVGA